MDFKIFIKRINWSSLKIFNKIFAQLKLPQVVGFSKAPRVFELKIINNVVKSGKKWFKIQYI